MQWAAAGSSDYLAWADKLSVLEKFNGRTLRQVPTGTGAVTVDIFGGTRDLLQQSYNALKSSVYESLELQTRLKPLLDEIQVAETEAGVSLDFSALNSDFASRIAANRDSGLRDLVDFTLATKELLKESDWNGAAILASYLDGDSTLSTIGAGSRKVVLGIDADNTVTGSGENDIVVSGLGNDTLSGGNGSDLLFGADGNDLIIGDYGSDTLVGGAGDDVLMAGNRTYAYSNTTDPYENTANTLEGGTGNDQLYGGGGGFGPALQN